MILLHEAIERFNRSAHPYGLRVSPWRRRGRAARLVGEIERAIAPLELPAELRAFWLAYDPSTVVRPALHGFIPLTEAQERRALDCPPAPSALFPLADWTQSRVWIELATNDHPGGRIFHSYHDESEVSLWAFGLSELFDILSTALDRDIIDDRQGGLHVHNFEALVRRHLNDAIGTGAPRRFEAVDRSRFPEHWQRAEGLRQDHFELRGATHTVAGLQHARFSAESVKATLQGRFNFDFGGGPLDGCVGTFQDETGIVQIFVPHAAAVTGALGTDGHVEVDVVAMQPNGSAAESIKARKDLEYAVNAGLDVGDKDLFMRLMAEMHKLDTSVVATALRPIW